MSGAKLRVALSITMFGVVLPPPVVTAQTQQAGSQTTGARQTEIQQPRGATASRSDATASSPAVNKSGANSGASGWSAGQGNFGTSGKVPGATSGAAGGAATGNTGQSSWVAGHGSFGSTVQAGGIWRERSGSSEAASTKSTNTPANGISFSAISPNFKSVSPALGKKPAGTPPAHAIVTHPSAGLHAGVGSHPAISKGLRSTTSGHPNARSATRGLQGRSNTPRRSFVSKGSGTKLPWADSTTPIPSGFTQSSSPSGGGAPDGGTAPGAPPL